MMINLLAANIALMWSNMLFRVGIVFGAALGIVCPLGAELGFWLSELTNGTVSLGLIAEKPILDYYFYTWTIFLVFYFTLFCSFYVGTEYSDGTLRNKVIVGHSRSEVYLSNFIANTVAGFVFYSAYLLLTICIGFPMLGGFQIFKKGEVVVYVLCVYGIMAALASLYTLIGMLVSNKAIAIVICVCIALVLFLVPIFQTGNLQWEQYFPDDWNINGIDYAAGEVNPYYIGGIRRLLSLFFLDFLPGGPLVQFYNFSYLYNYGTHAYALHPFIILMGIVFFVSVPMLVGMCLFKRKELK